MLQKSFANLLQGQYARLVAMQPEHKQALSEIAIDPEIWLYSPMVLSTPLEVVRYVHKALDKQQSGQHMPYVITLNQSPTIIGSTRYYDIDRHNRTLSIGYTWLDKNYWGKRINQDIKRLMLAHAFSLGFVRVSLKIDENNVRSRKAVEKIGFIYEGTLKKHLIMPDGHYRNTVVYALLDEDWEKMISSHFNS